jgi:hypothetical protein
MATSIKMAGVVGDTVGKVWGGALEHTGRLANSLEGGGTLGRIAATGVRLSPYAGIAYGGHKAITSGPVQGVRDRWKMHQYQKAQQSLEKGGSVKTAGPLASAFTRGLTFRSMKPAVSAAGKVMENTGPEHVLHQVGHLTGAAGILSGVTAGAGALHSVAKKGETKVKGKIVDPKNMRAIMDAHPTLLEADPKDIQAAYKTVKRLAPGIASDPLAAGSVMKNIIALKSESTGMMIDPSTIKTLADTQKSIAGSKPHGRFMDTFGKVNPLIPKGQVGEPNMSGKFSS